MKAAHATRAPVAGTAPLAALLALALAACAGVDGADQGGGGSGGGTPCQGSCTPCDAATPCPEGESCASGLCQRIVTSCPTSCPPAFECGNFVPPACPASPVACGACGPGTVCIEEPARSSCATVDRALACEGRSCGLAAIGDELFSCGGCGPGEVCSSGTCVETPRPLCWGEPRPLLLGRAPPDERLESEPRVVIEGDRPWLYASTKRWDQIDPDVGRYDWLEQLGKARLVTAFETVAGEPFLLSSDLAPVGADTNPGFSRTGLELFQTTTRHDPIWVGVNDRDLTLRVRESDHEAFGPSVFLPAELELADDGSAELSCGAGVLLADGRTLVYGCFTSTSAHTLRAARRPTAEPGDARFTRIPIDQPSWDVSPGDAEAEMVMRIPLSLTCDGSRLVYGKLVVPQDSRLTYDLHTVVAEGADDGVTLLSPQPFFGAGSPLGDDAVIDAFEGPGCEQLYFSNFEQPAPGVLTPSLAVASRVPCP